ncbi:MAG: GTPase Era [Planctomycetes bacterium]|nr:GTPase Era [Planctomycetota bacterium]
MQNKKIFRAGYVGVIGEPNVGKSTLINHYLGCKLSIVTHKPQTTRKKIMGVLTKDEYQIIFFDTPGIIEPTYELQKYMVKTAYNVINEADLVLMMIDPFKHPAKIHRDILEKLAAFKKPILLAINKVDLVEEDKLLPIIAAFDVLKRVTEIIPISAKEGTNLDRLLSLIVQYLPEGDPLFPEDYMTDYNERFLASEVIREKVFEFYGEEIPYSTTVEIEEFKEREKGRDYVKAIIYVERKSQKGIIIGENGKAIKQVGILARKDIEEQLGREIFLELHVKVMEKWRKDKHKLKKLGYE